MPRTAPAGGAGFGEKVTKSNWVWHQGVLKIFLELLLLFYDENFPLHHRSCPVFVLRIH